MGILDHQTNRNALRRVYQSGPDGTGEPAELILTKSVNDNFFVSHPIPRSDFQYNWVTSSAVADDRSDYGYGYITSSNNFRNVASATIKQNDGTDYGTDFLGTNIVFRTDLTTGATVTDYEAFAKDITTNTLSLKKNSEAKLSQSRAFISSINGPYRWSSFRQTRGGEHPVSRRLKNNNFLYLPQASRPLRVTSQNNATLGNSNQFTVQEKRNAQFDSYTESAVSMRHKPMMHHFEQIADPTIGLVIPLRMFHTYGNNLSYFGHDDIDKRLGLKNETLQIYDSLKKQYLNQDSQYKAVKNFIALKYSEKLWPKEENAFLKKVRERENFVFTGWRSARAARTIYSGTNAFGHVIPTMSAWPLDARENYQTDLVYGTGSTYHFANTGELQLDANYHNGDATRITSSLQFAHRRSESGSEGAFFSADTFFEVPLSAGVGPFFDSYDNYIDDLKRLGKGKSIVPEFKISDHMDFYLDVMSGDFLAGNAQLFSITGSKDNDSSNNSFFKTYSNSDFFKNFSNIKKDHKNIASPTHLTLNCKAITKLLPYKGFYPVQRTVQLATLFSQSYASSITYKSSDSPSIEPDPVTSFKIFSNIFFGPGLLFNSIKSGIAVDLFCPTSSFKDISNNFFIPLAGGGDITQRTVADNFNTFKALKTYEHIPYHISPYSNNFTTVAQGANTIPRFPFETLVEPESYISNLLIRDLIDSDSGSTNSLSIWGGGGKNNYKLAMHNFLAAAPDIFLENKTFTTLVSKADSDPGYFNFDSSKTYKTRIYLNSAENSNEISLFSLASNSETAEDNWPNDNNDGDILYNTFRIFSLTSSHSFSVPTFSYYDRPFFKRENKNNDYHLNLNFSKTSLDTYQHGGSAFGFPGKDAMVNIQKPASTWAQWGTYGFNTYAYYTPPYYEGFSFVQLEFNPTTSRRYNISEIFQQTTSSFFRWSNSPHTDYLDFINFPSSSVNNALVGNEGGNYTFRIVGPLGASTGNKITGVTMSRWKMQITASINIFQKINNKFIEYDKLGDTQVVKEDLNAGSKWAISPRWELPLFDYSNCAVTLPLTGSENVSRGVWHQYGSDLDNKSGLFLEVRDHPIRDIHYRFALEFTVSGNSDGDYTITINDTDFTYTASSVTAAVIKTNLISLINGGVEQVTAFAGGSDIVAVFSPTGGAFNYSTTSTGDPINVTDTYGYFVEKDISESAYQTNYASLADAVGFKKDKEKLGVLASKNSISEAIVMVPYRETLGGRAGASRREFLKIDPRLYALAERDEERAGESVRNMIKTMKKFVIPPQMDFVTYDGRQGKPKIDPFVMYLFEITRDLDREDLKKWWHNVMPSTCEIMKEHEITISHELDKKELMSEIPDGLQWMVFKVKQKGVWNYFSKTADSGDDERFKFDFKGGTKKTSVPDYSYNWPYDFCSLVELAEFDASVLMETPEESNRRRSGAPSLKIDIIKDRRVPSANEEGLNLEGNMIHNLAEKERNVLTPAQENALLTEETRRIFNKVEPQPDVQIVQGVPTGNQKTTSKLESLIGSQTTTGEQEAAVPTQNVNLDSLRQQGVSIGVDPTKTQTQAPPTETEVPVNPIINKFKK